MQLDISNKNARHVLANIEKNWNILKRFMQRANICSTLHLFSYTKQLQPAQLFEFQHLIMNRLMDLCTFLFANDIFIHLR